MFNAKLLAKELTSREFQMAVLMYWTTKCQTLVQNREKVARDDLEYFANQLAKLRDPRMTAVGSALIGWGDDDQAELEMFCAIALEVMKESSPSKLRDAALRVSLRSFVSAIPTQHEVSKDG